MSVLAPVCHILGVGQVHVAERSVTGVGRTGEHYILAVDLSREQNAVSVEGQVCVLHLVEFLEVLGPAHADSGLPGDPESVLDPYAAGIVAVLPRISLCGLGIVVDPLYLLRVDVPVDAVLGETSVDSHVSFLVVNTEYACEVALVAFEGNYCGVEDGVAGGKQVAGNDRVSVVTPDNVLAALGSVLPGHVRNALTKDF